MSLPVRIREARLEAGLTQEALAHACRVSTRTVPRWEAGHSTPQGRQLPALAEATGRGVSWFFETEEDDEETAMASTADELARHLRTHVEAAVHRVLSENGTVRFRERRVGGDA